MHSDDEDSESDDGITAEKDEGDEGNRSVVNIPSGSNSRQAMFEIQSTTTTRCIRKARDMTDAFNKACICGVAASDQEKEDVIAVVRCKELECETEWVCILTCHWYTC